MAQLFNRGPCVEQGDGLDQPGVVGSRYLIDAIVGKPIKGDLTFCTVLLGDSVGHPGYLGGWNKKDCLNR